MFSKKFVKEPTEKQKIGQIGEDCACEYLKKEGCQILDRNYNRKWGELDIVAKYGNKIHFVEVKSVSREITNLGKVSGIDAVHGASEERTEPYSNTVKGAPERSNKEMRYSGDFYRPEDNMHPWKLQRLSRAVQSYLLEKDIPDEVDWQFDLITVYVDMEKRLSRVLLIPDIVL